MKVLWLMSYSKFKNFLGYAQLWKYNITTCTNQKVEYKNGGGREKEWETKASQLPVPYLPFFGCIILDSRF